MNIPPYPLAWPDTQKRSISRVKSSFRTGLDGAMKNVRESLRLFAQDSGTKLEYVQITANVWLFDMKPTDPGIAVWFQPVFFTPCDLRRAAKTAQRLAQ